MLPSTHNASRVAPARPRQKRIQVAKACDGCRAQRTKCDNNYPCTNCRTKGLQCSNGDDSSFSSLAQACQEVSRLRSRVRDLEQQLQSRSQGVAHGLVTPPSLSSAHTETSPSVGFPFEEEKVRPCEGIMLRPPRSPNDSWFGPSSLYFFIKRLGDCMGSALRQTLPASGMLPANSGTKKLLAEPGVGLEPKGRAHSQPGSCTTASSRSGGVYLNPTQEQYFVDLFWHSYHTSVLPVLDEAEFKEHHQSLWDASAGGRRPSALVDIVLAICMQLGISKLTPEQQKGIADNADATIAGRYHYRRCQVLLSQETESPSLSTLQTHLLCAIYLCGGSFHNMVDSAAGQAVRTAYMLGLHLEPPASLPHKEAEKRRRLWWATYLMETKIGLKLGRPFLLRDSYSTPELPSDNFESARLSGSAFAPIGDNATWLSFNRHHTKLHFEVRAGHTAFYERNPGMKEGDTECSDARKLEGHANILLPHAQRLESWADDVPSALQTNRQNGGRPLSTDGSALEIEQFAPLWLQRQRLLLELAYHNLSAALFRPFISFTTAPAPNGVAEELARRCAAHAIAFTKMAHDVLSTTSILDGWHETFHWQWNTAVTLVGFLLAYPRSDLAQQVRETVDLALAVIDIFGASFAAATSAAAIVRDLCSKVDLLRKAGDVASTQAERQLTATDVDPATGFQDLFGQPMATDYDFQMSDPSFSFDMTNGYGQNLFDMALAVDFWDELDTLWPVPNTLFPEQQVTEAYS